MGEQNGGLAQAFGTGGTDIVLLHFLQEKRAIPAHAGADARHHADGDGQYQEFEGIHPGVITGNGRQLQQLADQVLPADDVEQRGNGHEPHAQGHAPEFQVGHAEKHQQERQTDVHQQPHHQGRRGDGQGRPHALADVGADVPPAVRTSELEQEQADGFPVENGLGQLLDAFLPFVQQQRQVVAPLALPFPYGFGRHVLLPQVHARHVVRRVDDEEQDEGEDVDPYQQRH